MSEASVIIATMTDDDHKLLRLRNGQLYRAMGLALRRLVFDDVDGAVEILRTTLRMTPEQLDDLAFKTRRVGGSHPQGEHLRTYPRIGNRRKGVKPSQRRRIFERDDHRCRCCGTSGDELNKLTIDHIVPICEGGTNQDSNLQVLCARCNLAKTVEEAPRYERPIDATRIRPLPRDGRE